MGKQRQEEGVVDPKKIKKPTKDEDDIWKHKLRKDIMTNDLKIREGIFG
jgi:hypothetical protein